MVNAEFRFSPKVAWNLSNGSSNKFFSCGFPLTTKFCIGLGAATTEGWVKGGLPSALVLVKENPGPFTVYLPLNCALNMFLCAMVFDL